MVAVFLLAAVLLLLLNVRDVTSQTVVSADIPKEDCGRYISVREGDSGTITSPFYPNAYPDKALCIWLLKAPIDFKFEFTISGMNGEAGEGENAACLDFVEVRLGGSRRLACCSCCKLLVLL